MALEDTTSYLNLSVMGTLDDVGGQRIKIHKLKKINLYKIGSIGLNFVAFLYQKCWVASENIVRGQKV